MDKVNLIFKLFKIICQKATFLNFMVKHIKKQKMKELHLGSNENKIRKKLTQTEKTDARFVEGQ